jgi:hypothetical protein
MSLEMPHFYLYYNRTYQLDRLENGNVGGFMLNLWTGGFDKNNRHIDEVLFAMGTPEISKLNENRFVQETEKLREHYLRGDGAVFALYDTIRALYAQALAEDRRITKEEVALVISLRKHTFGMWEDELARQAAGEPPSFTVRPIMPSFEFRPIAESS